jgi:hypothetical protein
MAYFYYLDEHNNTVPCVNGNEFMIKFKESMRRVSLSSLPSNAELSTVFLGINHRFSSDPKAPPIVFESKVFGGPHDQEMRRYSTYQEAVEGHEAWLKELNSQDY